MPLVQLISFRPCAVIAAIAIAFAAAAASGDVRAEALDAQAQEQTQTSDISATTNDEASAHDAVALNDQVLANQRGTGLGLMTVAASAQTLAGASSVTLWDEIAPPAPVPVPVDAARLAQSNSVSYFRK